MEDHNQNQQQKDTNNEVLVRLESSEHGEVSAKIKQLEEEDDPAMLRALKTYESREEATSIDEEQIALVIRQQNEFAHSRELCDLSQQRVMNWATGLVNKHHEHQQKTTQASIQNITTIHQNDIAASKEVIDKSTTLGPQLHPATSSPRKLEYTTTTQTEDYEEEQEPESKPVLQHVSQPNSPDPNTIALMEAAQKEKKEKEALQAQVDELKKMCDTQQQQNASQEKTAAMSHHQQLHELEQHYLKQQHEIKLQLEQAARKREEQQAADYQEKLNEMKTQYEQGIQYQPQLQANTQPLPVQQQPLLFGATQPRPPTQNAPFIFGGPEPSLAHQQTPAILFQERPAHGGTFNNAAQSTAAWAQYEVQIEQQRQQREAQMREIQAQQEQMRLDEQRRQATEKRLQLQQQEEARREVARQEEERKDVARQKLIADQEAERKAQDFARQQEVFSRPQLPQFASQQTNAHHAQAYFATADAETKKAENAKKEAQEQENYRLANTMPGERKYKVARRKTRASTGEPGTEASNMDL